MILLLILLFLFSLFRYRTFSSTQLLPYGVSLTLASCVPLKVRYEEIVKAICRGGYKMKRQKKQNTNLMMIDYLISNALAQNVILILMAIKKLFVTRLTKENLIDFVKAIILSFIFLFLFLALGEWKLRSMM